MEIRRYRQDDCPEILQLFYDTVHSVNKQDYTEAQLDVWADGEADSAAWNQSLLAHITYVAESDGRITGFGDITADGYLDRLYVHKDYQGGGVASALCDLLECETSARLIVTHASITARPFFEKRGYRVVRGQEVERKGVLLRNYVMEKEKDEC